VSSFVASQRARLLVMTFLTLLAFAANPVLCRAALRDTGIDPASFTLIRIVAGAATLWLILTLRGEPYARAKNWSGAILLFVYAGALSYAYVWLDAGIGTLLLFGAVQGTMISTGIAQGERLNPRQVFGVGVAVLGLLLLLAPGATAPTWQGAVLMVMSGLAWGIYSLMGRRGSRPLATTATNFLKASALAGVLSLLTVKWAAWDLRGAAYALASGSVSSGIGYAIWYSILPALRATHAAIVQLSVPAITAIAGIVFLGESLTLRLASASLAILGGVALVFVDRGR
jgi:drug/metabolite transporter (DMT)-like permease